MFRAQGGQCDWTNENDWKEPDHAKSQFIIRTLAFTLRHGKPLEVFNQKSDRV